MSTDVTIAEIEQAINYWCARQGCGENGALCANARPLADVYGKMIYEHATAIDASQLQPEQRELIKAALGRHDLPLGR
jgi:hypothetical protein